MKPRVSVLVVSYNAPATLERCLESLEAQLGPDTEIIVADCSTLDPRLQFRRQFTSVKFLRFERRLTIPELRREAMRSAGGEIFLLTEARVVPSKDWAALLVKAHTTHPKAPAVGGPLDSNPRSSFDAAVFFCEYGLHMAPAPDGEASQLSGANLSYKRWAIERCQDLVEAGAWEPFIHQRLSEQGGSLVRVGKAVAFYHNSLSAAQFARQRFHYGRWYAAARAARATRLLRAASCPVVPLVLTLRLSRLAATRGRLRRFLWALPWILPFQTIWAAGEFCGYLLGKGESDRQVF